MKMDIYRVKWFRKRISTADLFITIRGKVVRGCTVGTVLKEPNF